MTDNTKKNLGEFYDEKFYSKNKYSMLESAKIILEFLYKFYKPYSVIDIGCGQGAWLATSEMLGTTTLKGIDGEWVNKEDIISKNIDFSPVNFEEPLPELDRKYDLCISLEVAEHISESKANQFVDFICQASDIILFGAAIKYQGGKNHLNEQWQSYWIDMFKKNNYRCFDIIRPHLWNNQSIKWWYRQNTFLFASPNTSEENITLLESIEKPIFDVVHPMNYERRAKPNK